MSEHLDQITTLRLELAREKDKSEAFRHALNVEVLKVMRVAVIQATIDADNEIARLKARVKELEDARPIGTASKDDIEQMYYGYYSNPKDMTKPSLRMDDVVQHLTLSGFAVQHRQVEPGTDYMVGISRGEAMVSNLEGCLCCTISLYGPVYDSTETRMTLKDVRVLTSFPAKHEFTFLVHPHE